MIGAAIRSWIARYAVTGAAIACLAVIIWAVGIHGPAQFEAGQDDVRKDAALEALDRIAEMEKNNANFKSLDARERCLVFMRDSGLPESGCD